MQMHIVHLPMGQHEIVNKLCKLNNHARAHSQHIKLALLESGEDEI